MSIVNQLTIFRGNIIHILSNISGRAEPQAELFLLIALGYVILLVLLISLHRKLLKKQKKIHENLILLYDTIRYQLAKAQYEIPTRQESKGINIVMESDHKNYPANASAIKQEIMAIEQKNGQEIIAADQRWMIQKETQRKNRITIATQMIGRITTLLTVGIYKVFR